MKVKVHVFLSFCDCHRCERETSSRTVTRPTCPITSLTAPFDDAGRNVFEIQTSYIDENSLTSSTGWHIFVKTEISGKPSDMESDTNLERIVGRRGGLLWSPRPSDAPSCRNSWTRHQHWFTSTLTGPSLSATEAWKWGRDSTPKCFRFGWTHSIRISDRDDRETIQSPIYDSKKNFDIWEMLEM